MATPAPASAGGTMSAPLGRPAARSVPTPPPASGGPITSTLRFPLKFRDTDQFRRVFERDVQTGGLFIHTSRPPALDAIIEVEVAVEGLSVAPICLQARVVHRMEPPAGSQPGNLLAGMGVQFVDVERAVERLRALLR